MCRETVDTFLNTSLGYSDHIFQIFDLNPTYMFAEFTSRWNRDHMLAAVLYRDFCAL